MDAEFTSALEKANEFLHKNGADAAMLSVKEFFEKRQEAIKKYFDDKSLEETAAEMKSRLAQVHSLVGSARESKPTEVEKFLQELQSFLHEEFQYRAQEMQA